MIKNYFLLTALATLFTLTTQAQTGVLTGVVTDIKSKETLIGVTIFANDSAVATTNIDGKYQVNLMPKNYVIKFKYVGYEFLNKDAVVKASETTTLDVIMKETSTQLNEIVVSAGKFEQKLSEITVSMEIIKPELIANKGTTNISNIIEQTPGVSVIDGQANIRGGAGYSYGAGSRVAILVDDMPVLAADAGSAKWGSLPVENIAQMEVIKGASSSLYGSSALNGIINIRTAFPKDKPETKINIINGRYDRFNQDSANWGNGQAFGYHSADFHHSRKVGNFDLGIGGQYYMNNDFKQHSDEQRARGNFNTRYRFQKIKGLSVSLNGNFSWKKYGNTLLWKDGIKAPAMDSDTSNNYSVFVSTANYVDPSITYFTPKGAKFILRNRTFITSNVSNTNQNSRGLLSYNELQYSKRFTRIDMNLVGGFVQSFSDVKSQLYKNHTGRNSAGYVQADKKFFEKLNVSMGIRGEYFRIDDVETNADVFIPKNLSFKNETVTYNDSVIRINQNTGAVIDTVITQKTVTGLARTRYDSTILIHKSKVKPVMRIGLSYEITKVTFIRASFGQGYRFPTIAEKHINTVASGLTIISNPNLQAETGWSAEVGIKQGFKIGEWKGFLDVAGFWTEYQNMMQFTYNVDWADTAQKRKGIVVRGFKSINVGQARISGIDMTLVGKGKLTKDIDITILSGFTHMNPLNLNYLDFKNYNKEINQFTEDTTINNNILKFRFKNIAKIDVQVDYKKISLGVSYRYNSFMQNIDPLFESPAFAGTSGSSGMKEFRQLHNKGDHVMDLRFSYKINDSNKVAFLCNNMLNRLYALRPGVLENPRTFAIQYSLNF
jgi:outer membrane cobalamin receptor